MIHQARVDRVGIVKASAGMYAASAIRVKIECLAQLAAKHNLLPCNLVSAPTIAKAEKTTEHGEMERT
jgi:hypothetical protein